LSNNFENRLKIQGKIMQNKPKLANFASDTKKSSEDEKKEFANSIIFNNLMGEGEKYLRDSLYDKSIKSYTKVK